MTTCIRYCMLVLLLLLVRGTLHAQQLDTLPAPLVEEPPDTTPLTYILPQNPERSLSGYDTLPDFNFRMYDPARRFAIDWGTLGNLGSSARPLLYTPRAQRGFDPGVHAFDLYHTQPDELRFYRNTRSFSEVFFSQGGSQKQGLLNARLARTFAGGANVALDYRTINNSGQFRHQADKHNTLLIGVWIPVGSRYNAFLIFCNNINRQQDNGGIVSDTVFSSGNLNGPVSAEVRLPSLVASTRLADQTLQLTQHLDITGGKDAGKRVLRATHTLAWNKQNYKFSDVNPIADTSYWGDFLVDFRGLRNFFSVNRLNNTVGLTTFKAKNTGRPSDVFTLGLTHSFIKIKEDLGDSTLSNLFLTGNLAITPSDRFAFTADGALGVLANFGEYQVNGALILNLGKIGTLRGTLLSQRYPPSLIERLLIISKRVLWQQEFEKPVTNTISATYALPRFGLEVTARTNILSNYIYYDQNSRPVQTSAAINVAQLIVTENIRFRSLHFDNTFALQQSNRPEIIRLPRWFSKNSLYFSGRIFKKRMLCDAGVDFRINSDFRPDGYQPLTWQFRLNDSLTAKPYPWVDAFISFKVQTFRFFVRYENVRSLFNKKEVFYQTAYHPQPFNALRIGINWRFMDGNKPVSNGPSTGTGNSGSSGNGGLGRPPGTGGL